MHEQTMRDFRRAGLRASWKYPLYRGGFRLWEVKQSILRADLSMMLNAEDRQYAETRLGADPERLVIVDNGVHSAHLGGSQPLPLDPRAGLQIVVLGRLSPRKGSAEVKAVLERLLPAKPHWRVRLLGTQESESDVLARLDPRVHSQVTVVPTYANADLTALTSGANVLLFPTHYEGQPLALVEAMACGLVPVASNVPGVRHAASHDHNSILAPVGDTESICQSLLLLERDGELMQRLRAQAFRDAQRFSWPTIAEAQIAMYEDRLTRSLMPTKAQGSTGSERP